MKYLPISRKKFSYRKRGDMYEISWKEFDWSTLIHGKDFKGKDKNFIYVHKNLKGEFQI